MMERLDLKVQRPTEAAVFAARKLRELAAVFEAKADKADPSGDSPVAFAWIQAAARCSLEARELDEEDRLVRIQLTPEEAYALSDLMDDNRDSSFGGSWRSGRSGAIDWTTFELVVSRSADAGGHIPEAISWSGLGKDDRIDPLLISVRSKIYAVARSIRDSA